MPGALSSLLTLVDMLCRGSGANRRHGVSGGTLKNYELRPLSNQRLDELAQEWSRFDDEAFEVELAAVFAWARAHLTPKENNSHAVELYSHDTETAHAIIELVNSKRGALSKMLKLWISPELWGQTEDDAKRIIEMHAAAFVKVIAHSSSNDAVQEIKIYGRTNVMLDMLSRVRDVWNDQADTGWTAKMAGRWLAISRTQ